MSSGTDPFECLDLKWALKTKTMTSGRFNAESIIVSTSAKDRDRHGQSTRSLNQQKMH
jgi:hypothetical protein